MVRIKVEIYYTAIQIYEDEWYGKSYKEEKITTWKV